jgi:hypothetical protein
METPNLPLQSDTPAPKATPKAAQKAAPKVTYRGEGAEKVKFTLDPNAKNVVVHATGIITADA